MQETMTLQQEQAATSAIINTGINVFDSGAFEAIFRVADAMAHSPLVPESLRTKKVNGQVVALSHEEVRANCFLVSEQAQRWGISPFACIGCASNIYGRLMWEGKLVAGVLEAKLGVRLNYEYEGTGEKMSVTVIGTLPGETTPRTVKGTVADWKTDQWKGSAYEQRLSYRGAREWARRHAPSILLGVYTEDEFTPEMRDVTPTRTTTVIPATQQIDPFKGTALEEKKEDKQPEAKAEPAAKQDEKGVEPSDAVFQKSATFVSLEEKSNDGSNGKKAAHWFEVNVTIENKAITFYTFSKTLAESLRELESGTAITVSVKESNKRGVFTLVDYKLANGKGGLLV